MKTVVDKIQIDTVGDLLDALAKIAKDPLLSGLMDSAVESDSLIFTHFRIIEQTLSDKSKVLNFELTEG